MKKNLILIILAIFIFFIFGLAKAADYPPAPENLKGEVVKDESGLSIKLEWNQEDSSLGYRVTRQEKGGSEEEIYLLEPDPTGIELSSGGTVVDIDVKEGMIYTYSIISFDIADFESATAKITIVASACKPEFTTFAGESKDSGVVLSWSSVCDTVEYKLYRDNSLITTTTQTSFTDTSAPEGDHEYKIEAYNTKTSAWSPVLGRAMAAKTTEKIIKLTVTKPPVRGGTACSNPVNTEFGFVCDLGDFVNKFLPFLIGILGGIAFLMMIIAGYIYMTSQGDQAKVGLAKEIIIGVLAGIALLFFIGLLMRQIGAV